jgi:hypothetical protein
MISFCKLRTLIIKTHQNTSYTFYTYSKVNSIGSSFLQAIVVFSSTLQISDPNYYYAPCAIWLLSHSTNGVKYPKS